MIETMQTKGKNIMMFIDGTAVALATNHTLNFNPQIDETATKDDALGPAGDIDIVDWGVSADSVVGANADVSNELTYEELIAAQLSGAAVNAVMDAVPDAVQDEAVPAAGWSGGNVAANYPKRSGQAMISEIAIEASDEGFATMNVQLAGTGPLS